MMTLSVAFGIGLSLAIAWGPPAETAAENPSELVLQFAAVDHRPVFSVPVSRDLVLEIRRTINAQGDHIGWDLAARDRRLTGSPNFFDDCPCGHGPRPHDYYAWHFVSKYYPHERRLAIYGYPLEVRVQCPDCEAVETDARDARFIKGKIEVSVRRLASSNPRQRRVADVVGHARK